jgi:xanthine dehydrogenase accessory factor
MTNNWKMWTDILDEASRLSAADQAFVLATVVAYRSPQSAKPGSKAIIRLDGTITGWVGGGCVQPIVLREAKKAIETGQPKLLSICPDSTHDDWEGVESYRMSCEGGGSLEIYLEPVLPKPDLLIVGRSPVAEIASELGILLGFNVCLADPDASKEHFPQVHSVLTDLSSLRTRITEASFVVVATMGHGDEEGLQSVIGTTPRYLGLVASKKKAKALFEYLREQGATAEQLALVKCPAGLELGGKTMPEIALSVMAEITSVRRAIEATPETTTEPAITPAAPLEAIDPICGMTVQIENARYTSVLNDKTVYFCSLGCKARFDTSPESYPPIMQITQTGQK